MNKSYSLFSIIILISIILNSPIAKAQQTETIQTEIFLDPENKNYTKGINIANITDSKYSNLNLSINPFIVNNSKATGRIIAPFLFPYIINTTEAYTSLTLGHFVRFNQNQIMNGISELFLRLPITNLTATSSYTIKIYRSWISKTSFNVNFTGGNAIFNQPNALIEILNITESIQYSSRTWHNTTLNQTINTLGTQYNLTWVKLSAPILPGEKYFIMYNFTGISNNSHLLFSPCDVLDDQLSNAWINIAGNETYIAADPDLTLIATLGMGEGIAGVNNNYTNNSFLKAFYRYNITVDKVLTAPNNRYVSYVIPIITSGNTTITHGVEIYQNTSLLGASAAVPEVVNGYYHLIDYLDLQTAGALGYVTHIALGINCNQTDIGNISLYFEAKEDYTTQLPYTDHYLSNASSGKTKMIEKYHFSIFGSIVIGTSFWQNVVRDYAIIYAQEPETEAKLLEVYSKYKAGLEINAADIFRWVVFGHSAIDNLPSGPEATLIIAGKLGLIDLIRNALSAKYSIAGFGIYLWGIIEFTIDSLMYIGYLALKSFYGILSVLIYYLGIFSTLAIFGSFEAYFFFDTKPAKQIKKRDLRKEAYNKAVSIGWNKTYRILSLIIGMFILAFAIFNAIRSLIPVI